MTNQLMHQTKVQGATLIEVLTALVILAIVFSLSLMIFINVTSTVSTKRKIRANQYMQQIADETLVNQSYIDDQYQFENFRIEKTIKNYKKQSGLALLHLKAVTPENKTIVSWKQLVLTDAKQNM